MNRWRNALVVILLPALALISACGPSYKFGRAQELEKKGFFVEAAVEYEKIYKKHTGSERAAESLYRLGRIYQKKLKIYSHANRFFRELADKYPSVEPWYSRAREGILNSPDYYPLTPGSFWIEGDSATGGRNMRAEWNCSSVSSGTFKIERKVYAGASLVTKIVRYFRKKDMQLQEGASASFANSSVVLQYPFATGKSWKSIRDGRPTIHTVVEENVALKVGAGEFEHCIKISEEYPDLPGTRKYNYYAAEVGWVLTTISGAGREHRNTELLSYKINPEE
ncbi:MAG: hypothetical protein A2219_08145 [Elusimicrobia bacterium RIFOXYA2_FULL_50_26]|nr:MAG: hypothetical protein A2219_08145 [Elusimicrobia bacterium RIFOXYA2_FULL_50_26]OGS25127.1 MAG: hypothetical protein A2314_05925 [Elusimicrobia bacterium RIFOXYB2_FULL_50_12]